MSENDNDKPNPEDGHGKGKPRHPVAVAALIGVALIALCFAFTAFMPRPTPESASAPATGEAQAAAEAQSGQDPDDEGRPDSVAVANEACEHDWTITYRTVHHDAVTHTETVKPVYTEQTTCHTVCNECMQVIDGKADDHIRATGHSGYSTNVPITDEVMTSEGYIREVTDTPAYDETVPDGIVCTICGVERPVDGGQAD